MQKRRCPRCKTPKPLSEWYRGKNVAYCILCSREIQKARRKKGGKALRRKESKRLSEYYKSRLEIINTAKNKPCMDCGVPYPPHVTDFDHVRGRKSQNIATMLSSCAPMKRILAEIEKCDVVCSNCHRQRTHLRSRVH